MPPRQLVTSSNSSSVWTVVSCGVPFEVRTSSVREALALVSTKMGAPARLVGLVSKPVTPARATSASSDAPKRRPPLRVPESRLTRRKAHFVEEARRRHRANESITSIAKAIQVPRETVRDWLRAAA
ncbi:MAG: hypothetical protein ACHREM_09400 [Polyangiales bacterium]